MALSTETATWLEDLRKEGSLSEEDYGRLKTTMESNSKADGFVKGSVLRQSDYSRRQADIDKAKKDLEDAQALLATKEVDLTKFQTSLGEWKAGAEGKFNKAISDREKADRNLAAALAKLRAVATANGLDEEAILKDIEVPVVPEKKTIPDFDASGFVRKEDLARGIQDSALVDASIHDVAMEYQELTGKPLRGAAEMVQEAIQKGLSIKAYAEQKFGFAKLRADRDEAAVQERIKKGVEEGVTTRLSEANLHGAVAPGRSDLKGSPVLRSGGFAPPAKEAGESGVGAAVAAFNAGTYKGGR